MFHQVLDGQIEKPSFYGKQKAGASAAKYGDFPVGEGFTFKLIRISKTFEGSAVIGEGVAVT